MELAPGLAAVSGTLAILGLVVLLVRGPKVTRWIIAGFLATWALAFAVPQTRILLSERYLTLTLGPLLAASALALTSARRWPRTVMLGTALALFVIADAIYAFDPRVGKGPNYREPAYYLASVAQPTDVLVEADLAETFDYYVLQVTRTPVQIVRPPGGTNGETLAETAHALEVGVKGVRSAWYMPRWTEGFWDPQHRIRAWLDANLCLESNPYFDIVELRQYVACK